MQDGIIQQLEHKKRTQDEVIAFMVHQNLVQTVATRMWINSPRCGQKTAS